MPNTYTSVSEMSDRLGARLQQLLDVAAGTDVSANATLLAAISSANSTVDSYLRARYELPLGAVPTDLVNAATSLALYQLASFRPEIFTEADTTVYENAIKYLTAISNGRAALDVESPSNAESVALPRHVIVGSTAQSGGRSIFDQPWRDSY